MATLEKNLSKARKGFGESSEQAIYRWGVQVARELAGVTQAYGKNKSKQQQQEKAIYYDALNVLRIVRTRPAITDPKQCYEWIERHRTRKGRRTAILPDPMKKTVTLDVMNQAIAVKMQRVGMAKGAWLGSGLQLTNKQSGMQKVNIGKNFLAYAQKWARLGNSIVKRSIFKPSAVLTNTATHSGSDYVLPQARKKTVVKRGLINTLKWYDKATTAKLAKIK